jgi:D-alanyl-lipoteichoic acid acyltransferase DltB (MBOAT superfamily)
MMFLKKSLIADNLAVYVDSIYSDPYTKPRLALLLASYFFAIQIYCDFSGYTDIARGSARFLGIELIENFRSPYLATSMKDFWRRWHISLSSWFRDYVYFPLGGNRVSRFRQNFNIMLVFLVSGLWHGANWTFVVWGALHGFYLMGEGVMERIKGGPRIPSWLKILFVFHLSTFAWIFFRANSLPESFFIVRQLFTLNLSDFYFDAALIGRQHFAIAILFSLMLLLYESPSIGRKILEFFNQSPMWSRWLVYYAALFILVFLGKFNNHQFVYFQF